MLRERKKPKYSFDQMYEITRSVFEWKTSAGKEVCIKDLNTNHIKNILRKIGREGVSFITADCFLRKKEWIYTLNKELIYREKNNLK